MGIVCALPKGRMLNFVIEIFQNSGFLSSKLDIDNLSRKLVFEDEKTDNRFLLAKPKDVPVYVEHGAADIGISGKDVIMEHGRNLYELLDLGIGSCKLVIAVPEKSGIRNIREIPEHSRVATSYPAISRNYFKEVGIQVEIIYLNGSVELAPLVDLSDIIVDISSTGNTLKKNNLISIGEIMNSSARLIVNNVSYKTKYKEIGRIIERIKETGGIFNASVKLSS
jgi:ATP phosphoribosyltransferase